MQLQQQLIQSVRAGRTEEMERVSREGVALLSTEPAPDGVYANDPDAPVEVNPVLAHAPPALLAHNSTRASPLVPASAAPE